MCMDARKADCSTSLFRFGIDDECAGFAMREEGLVAKVTRRINKRHVEGDNIAILRDFIESNTDSFRRVIEQHFESFSLCHLGDQ